MELHQVISSGWIMSAAPGLVTRTSRNAATTPMAPITAEVVSNGVSIVVEMNEYINKSKFNYYRYKYVYI